MNRCAKCLVITLALLIIFATSFNVIQGFLFQFLKFEKGTCEFAADYTCEDHTLRHTGSNEDIERWVAMFGQATFTSENGVTACSVLNTQVDSLQPDVFLRLLRGVPAGWSPESQSLAGCQSAATTAIGVARSCYLIGGDMCNANPALSVEQLKEESQVKLWSIIPFPVFPIILLVGWCIIESCLGTCGGCPSNHDPGSYAPMKLMEREGTGLGIAHGDESLEEAREDDDEMLLKDRKRHLQNIKEVPRGNTLFDMICGCKRIGNQPLPSR